MAKGFKHGGGGGANPLNFTVKAYPSEVELNNSTATENTIGVVTTNPITGWCFASEQPENMAEGEVWFSTGKASPAEFNALKKNNVTVYPLSAKQMVSGALKDVTAKSYHNGEWVDLNQILIKDGVITAFAEKNGGFKTRGLAEKNDNPMSKAPTVTIESDCVQLTITSDDNSYWGGVYYLGEKYDLTSINKVEVDLWAEFWGTAGSCIGIWTDFGNYSIDNIVAKAETSFGGVAATVSGRETLTIDTSMIKGEHYVGIYVLSPPLGYTQNTTKIYNMNME